jgi:tetratricopeptide (TPR) repeat protein
MNFLLRKYKAYLLVLALTAISFFTYSNSLENGFVFDDTQQLLHNPWIVDFSRITHIFSSHVWEFHESFTMSPSYYRPVMHLIYTLEYALFGMSSYHYHFLNIALHTLNGIILFLLLIQVQKSFLNHTKKHSPYFVPFGVAIFFLVHPIQTETVNWIAAMPELTYAFFFLLSLVFYLKKKFVSRLFSLIFFIGALLSKETALTFIPFLYFFTIFILDADKKKSLLQKSFDWLKKDFLFILIALLFLITRYVILQNSIEKNIDDWLLFFLYGISSLIAMPEIIFFYIQSALFPLTLSFQHIYEFGTQATIFYAAACILAVIIFIYKSKQKQISFPKEYIFGILLFFVPLLPAFQFYTLGHFTLSERYAYLPLAGLLFIIFAYLHKHSKRSLVIFLVSVLLIASICITQQRNTDWKNTLTLFQSDLEIYPDSFILNYYIAHSYALEGNNKFYPYYKKSFTLIEQNPEKYQHYILLKEYYPGHVSLLNGKPALAVNNFHTTLSHIQSHSSQFNKFFHIIYRDMAVAYYIMNNPQLAQYYFQRMEASSPQSTHTHRVLGHYYCHIGSYEVAEKHFMYALEYGDLPERVNYVKNKCSSKNDFLTVFKETNIFMQ